MNFFSVTQAMRLATKKCRFRSSVAIKKIVGDGEFQAGSREVVLVQTK